MATLHHFTPPPFNLTTPNPPSTLSSSTRIAPWRTPILQRRAYKSNHRCAWSACSYKVVVEHGGEVAELEVDSDETILEKALEAGLSVPHDCKLGVCMTCPARLVSGAVDQSEGMLSDDVVERGYALLCVSYPRSDCRVRTIPEEELLSLQLATAND